MVPLRTLQVAYFVSFCLLHFTYSAPGKTEQRFIGWEGDSYNPNVVWKDSGSKKAWIAAKELDKEDASQEEDGRSRWIEQISWKPRAYLFHNFLSDKECDHIIGLAAPYMKRSTVVGDKSANVLNNIRTSYGTFIRRNQDDVIAEVEERLASWTHIPAVNQEDTQVLRYSTGQKYGAHSDVIGGRNPRGATVLMYLSDVKSGGETAFPRDSEWADPSQGEKHRPWSDCAQGHVAANAKKGDALLFFSLNPDGRTPDSAAMHTGCPVIEGIKWTATKWIHVGPFRPATFIRPKKLEPPADPGFCEDRNERCEDWSADGECNKNPGYMVGEGSPESGQCRKSCGACEECSNKTDGCYARNRQKAGYLTLG